MISNDEAIRRIRQMPECALLLRDAYLDRDVAAASARFGASEEFAETRALVGDVAGRTLVEIGAGNGMATRAWATAGATAIAVDPDLGTEAGLRASAATDWRPVCGIGEQLPLQSSSADIIYVRQVLHHCRDLRAFLAECARVLVRRGVMLACREHVAENERELRAFLRNHPLHGMTGAEWAYPLATYLDGFASAGLIVDRVIAPWDSVINAFPGVRSTSEVRHAGRESLRRRLGRYGEWLGRIGIIAAAAQAYATRDVPGRLYSFVARKPS